MTLETVGAFQLLLEKVQNLETMKKGKSLERWLICKVQRFKHIANLHIPRDPSTFSDGNWTLHTYITVSPITF